MIANITSSLRSADKRLNGLSVLAEAPLDVYLRKCCLSAITPFPPTTTPVANAAHPRRADHAPAPLTPAWPTAIAVISYRSTAPNRGDDQAAAIGNSVHVSAWASPLGGASALCMQSPLTVSTDVIPHKQKKEARDAPA